MPSAPSSSASWPRTASPSSACRNPGTATACAPRCPGRARQGNAGGNIVLMGHRDTVFPDGEAGPPALHHPRRPRLRPRRRRHEGRAGDELLRPGRLRQVRRHARRRWSACSPATRRSAAPRAARSSRPRRARARVGVQQRARPAHRQRRHRAQGRRVHGACASPAGPPIPAATSRTASAPSRSWPARSWRIHALTDLDRGITLNVGLVSGGQSVNTVAPWAEGQIDLRYIDPADRDDVMAAHRRHHRPQLRPGHEGRAGDQGRVRAADADARPPSGCSTLYVEARGRQRAAGRGRVHRRLRR